MSFFLIHYLIHKLFEWILTEFIYGHCRKQEWRTDTVSAPIMLTDQGSTFDLNWRGEGSTGEKKICHDKHEISATNLTSDSLFFEF